jgi:hypothetical protein
MSLRENLALSGAAECILSLSKDEAHSRSGGDHATSTKIQLTL